MKKVIKKATRKESSVKNDKPIIYQTPDGAVELRADFRNETVWATQAQMATVFGVNTQAITKHIKNIYKEKELVQKATCSKLEQVRIEGNRKVTRTLETYNLDVLIAVGYRTNSVTGTKFRQWATKTLKAHITQGYTINKKVIGNNWEEFSKAIESAKKLLPKQYQALSSTQALDLASLFARTWLSLDSYDKQALKLIKPTKKNVKLTADELSLALLDLKQMLLMKSEATELFATDRQRGSLEGIVGNVMQIFGDIHAYESVEAKAAHLMYFIIKNHPFVDGNKRSGAFAFLWFLEKCKRLDVDRMTPEALTALTLLVAESKPSDKENIVNLIMKLIER